MQAVGLLLGAQRHQQLELQRLLLLAHRLHPSDPAEERIAGVVDPEGQPEIAGDLLRKRHPALPERRDVVGAADADVFAHPEGLQPVEMARGLATEAIGGNVEEPAARRHRTTARRDRIDGIAGGRRQHEVGRRQRRGPVSPGIEAADRYVDLAFRAVQAADAAEQVREALQIARPLELPAVHDGRKAHHLGVRFAIPRDQRRKPLHDIFIERGAAIDAPESPSCGTAHRRDGPADRRVPRGCGAANMATFMFEPHSCKKNQSRKDAGTALISVAVPMLARMRSLLIMIGAESTSRRWRPMLTSVSLR